MMECAVVIDVYDHTARYVSCSPRSACAAKRPKDCYVNMVTLKLSDKIVRQLVMRVAEMDQRAARRRAAKASMVELMNDLGL